MATSCTFWRTSSSRKGAKPQGNSAFSSAALRLGESIFGLPDRLHVEEAPLGGVAVEHAAGEHPEGAGVPVQAVERIADVLQVHLVAGGDHLVVIVEQVDHVVGTRR